MLEKFLKFVRKNLGSDWGEKPPAEYRFFRVGSHCYRCRYRGNYFDAERMVLREHLLKFGDPFNDKCVLVSGSWCIPGPIENYITRGVPLTEAFQEMIRLDPSLEHKDVLLIRWPNPLM